MLVRAYLRASTKEQDAARAKDALVQFASERGWKIAAFYYENESGAKLNRPELFRLLDESEPNDVILVEQIDRLSRLGKDDWESLRSEIKARKVRIVAPELPTSWVGVGQGEFMDRIGDAINGMLLDMLAAIARKDYDDRRRRQAQGIARERTDHPEKYRGRPENAKRNDTIAALLNDGKSWSFIQRATGCSKDTLARVARRVKESIAA
jgi:DNA invertase Pin-like site-specific DNA recombinase